jgi:O-antigen ligase
MTSKAIQNIILVLIFLTLLTPFIVFDSAYFPYILGKVVVFRTLVALMLLFYGWLIFKDSRFFPTKNGIVISFALLLLFYLISAILGESFRDSVFSNFERMIGWVTYLFFFIFLLITSSVMKVKKHWNTFFFLQIATSLILFVIGVKELIEMGINTRIDATLGNPIYLSVMFLFSIFFALYLLFENYSKGIKIALAVSIVINGLGVFFTGTRGTMVGIFIAFLLLAILFTVKYWKNKHIKILGTLFLVVIVLAPTLIFSFQNSDFVRNNHTLTRITQINIEEGTGYARFVNWGIAWQGIKERPVFGWGQENYGYVYDKYYDPRMYAQEPFFDSSHNIVLDVWVHGGILALLAYLSIFFFAVRYIFRKEELNTGQKHIITGLLLAYFIQNLFVFDTVNSLILFVTVLAFISPWKESSVEKRSLVQSLMIIFIALAGFLIAFSVVLPWRANTSLRNALAIFETGSDGKVIFYHQNGVRDNLDLFKKSLDKNQTGVFQIRNQASNASFKVRNISSNDPKIIKDVDDFYKFVLQQWEEEIERNENNARVFYAVAFLFARSRNLDVAETYINRALEITPNRHKYLDLLAGIKRGKGNGEHVEVLKNIYELEKTNSNGWVNYVLAVSETDEEKFGELFFAQENDKHKKVLLETLNAAIKDGTLDTAHSMRVARLLQIIDPVM